MKQWFSLIAMIRIGNAFMASLGTALGYWISSAEVHVPTMIVLMGATMAALGFGNVLNDTVDIDTDRIAHPSRPLVTGVVSLRSAQRFAFVLAIIALSLGFFVSTLTGFAVFIPLVLLWIYAYKLKSTVLWGNSVVALLVAYTLLFGALGGEYEPLLIPAVLAALGNFIREIMKDFADKEGDESAGLVTSASLSPTLEQAIVVAGGLVYLLILPYPFVRGDFGEIYLVIVLLTIFPLHTLWMWQWRRKNYLFSAKLLKLQMLMGLLAVGVDYLLR